MSRRLTLTSLFGYSCGSFAFLLRSNENSCKIVSIRKAYTEHYASVCRKDFGRQCEKTDAGIGNNENTLDYFLKFECLSSAIQNEELDLPIVIATARFLQ